MRSRVEKDKIMHQESSSENLSLSSSQKHIDQSGRSLSTSNISLQFNVPERKLSSSTSETKNSTALDSASDHESPSQPDMPITPLYCSLFSLIDSPLPTDTSSGPRSALGLFRKIKRQDSIEKKISAQLAGQIQAMIEKKGEAEKDFSTFVKQLTSLDTQTLQAVLILTRQTISVKTGFLKQLETDLNSRLKPVVNLIIDSLHSMQAEEEALIEKNQLNIKLRIQEGIIAISLIEKLLFPKADLQYCRKLAFSGFHDEDKKKLGDFLKKIDTRFEIEPWLLRWQETSEGIGHFSTLFFKENPHRVSDEVVLRLEDSQHVHPGKYCCC